MGKGLDQLEDLRDDGVRYARLKWAQIRLRIVDNTSTLLSKAFGYIIFLVLIFLALAFLMVALSLWIGEMLGHMSLGFLISGGAFLIGGLVVYFIRDKLVADTLVRYFIDIFFPEDDEDGTQE